MVKSVNYSKIILYADDIVVLNKNKDISILKWQIENELKKYANSFWKIG